MARHEDLPIPIHSTLEPVYGTGPQFEAARKRFDHLKSRFIQFFGLPPDFFARSPGQFHLFISISIKQYRYMHVCVCEFHLHVCIYVCT